MNARTCILMIGVCVISSVLASAANGQDCPPVGTFTSPFPADVPLEVRIPSGQFLDPRKGGKSQHGATDYLAPYGTYVYPIANGVVTAVYEQKDWGNYIVVRYGVVGVEGPSYYYTLYAHLEKKQWELTEAIWKEAKADRTNPYYKIGFEVPTLFVLGTVGQTGNAAGTPPHLHLELVKNCPSPANQCRPRKIDPEPCIKTETSIGGFQIAGVSPTELSYGGYPFRPAADITFDGQTLPAPAILQFSVTGDIVALSQPLEPIEVTAAGTYSSPGISIIPMNKRIGAITVTATLTQNGKQDPPVQWVIPTKFNLNLAVVGIWQWDEETHVSTNDNSFWSSESIYGTTAYVNLYPPLPTLLTRTTWGFSSDKETEEFSGNFICEIWGPGDSPSLLAILNHFGGGGTGVIYDVSKAGERLNRVEEHSGSHEVYEWSVDLSLCDWLGECPTITWEYTETISSSYSDRIITTHSQVTATRLPLPSIYGTSSYPLNQNISVSSKVAIPSSFILEQNYPNPFNPLTNISLTLLAESHVQLDIYNIIGQRVATLTNGLMAAGKHTLTWDGSKHSSGIYFYRLTTGDFVESKKMLLLK